MTSYPDEPDAVVTAAFHDDRHVLLRLLDAGISIETRDESGCTPLMVAVEEGFLGLVELLLERGADVNAADNMGDTPLAVARYRNHADIVKMLERHSATAPEGPSGRERRDDLVYEDFRSADAVRRLVSQLRKKE